MEEQNCGNSRADDFLQEIVQRAKENLNILIVFPRLLLYGLILPSYLAFGFVSTFASQEYMTTFLGTNSKSFYHKKE